MSSLSSGTGRIEPPKIEFECNCGKKYRVSATKAGKSVRCKRCRVKITVPGSMRISMRTRQAILEELGIDPYELAPRMLRALFKMVFRDGYFHGDLHPGNILIDADGVVQWAESVGPGGVRDPKALLAMLGESL